MRRRFTKTATTTILAAALMAGGSLIAATPAHAEPTKQLQVREPVWVPYKAYRTREACRHQGREMLNGGVVIDYDCTWGSPYWTLWVRIE